MHFWPSANSKKRKEKVKKSKTVAVIPAAKAERNFVRTVKSRQGLTRLYPSNVLSKRLALAAWVGNHCDKSRSDRAALASVVGCDMWYLCARGSCKFGQVAAECSLLMLTAHTCGKVRQRRVWVCYTLHSPAAAKRQPPARANKTTTYNVYNSFEVNNLLL